MIIEKRIPLSYPFNLIKWDLFFMTLFSVLIHFLSKYFITFNLSISIAAFMGTAIALILSFKLSQSYDRWWEARKIWGAIVNDSRTLVIQLCALNYGNIDIDSVTKIAYRQMGWCYALGQNLRKQDALQGINLFVNSDEYQKLKIQKNIPLALLSNHALDIAKMRNEKTINDFQHIQMDNTVTRLCASMGMAERIKGTIFPTPYRLTLQLFMYLFLVILAISLTELESFIEIPLLVLISLPFFLLEKIAFRIQDPFENRPMDTAMTTIARTIEINIRQLLDEEKIPEPLKPHKFYSL